MSLANLSAAYTRMRAALEEVAYEPGEWPENKHIVYCRWCNYAKWWVEKNGHQGDCPLRTSSPPSITEPV